MFTTGSKWFFGLAGAAVVAALVYGGATNPNEVGMSTFTGVLTLGYKGGVGDHIGYAILLGIAGAGIFLGATTAAFRDSEVAAEADLIGGPVPEVVAPVQGSYWPVIGAFGAGTVVVGMVTTAVLVGLGVVIVLAATFEWAITAWSEKATVDPEVNAGVKRRVLLPFEVPVLGAIGVGIFVFAASQILLTVPKIAVYFIFFGAAAIVMLVAVLFSAKPQLNRSAVAALCVIGALALLAGGVVSTIVGPRDIEPHHEDEEHEGAPLLAPDAPVDLTGAAS